MKPNQGKFTTTQPTASLSAKALEYYRMYAASEELPKYFSGVETDALCRRTRHNTQSGTLQSTSTPTTSTTISTVKSIAKSSQVAEIPEIVVDDVCASPTSSILSTTNKKQLEWDSGADIGYVNCEARLVQKSISMPILEEPTKVTCCKSSVTGLDTSGHRYNGPKEIDRLSCGDSGDSENTDDTSTGKYRKTHTDTLSFLRMKVGLPLAESTPVELRKSGSDPAIYTEQTTKIPNVQTAKSKKSYIMKHQKSRQLNTTIFNYEVAPSSTADVSPDTANITNQLSSTHISLSCQPSAKSNQPPICSLENLSKTTYLARYRRAKIKSFAITTPISIECVSNITTENTQTQTNDTRPIRVTTTDTDVQTSRRSSRQEVLNFLHSGDGLHFFNKLEESSISNSMCTNFSSSEGAVEMFSNCNSFEYICGNFQEPTRPATTASVSDDQTQDKSLPILSNSTTVTSELSSEYIKGVSRVFSSSTTTTKEDTPGTDMQKSLKMMTKLMKSKKYDEHFKQVCIRKLARRLLRTEETTTPVERKIEAVGYKTNESDHHTTISTTTKVVSGNTLKDLPSIHNESDIEVKPSTLKKQINADWKESLTMSEKMYASIGGNNAPAKNSDPNLKECLVDFAKREREHQLDWIKNEIQHLAKLKNVLEPKNKKSVNTKATISASVPIMKHDLKKTTSVYLITTEKANESCDKNCGMRASRNVNGEIDFHVHNNLGVQDYKFKEIITKITPKDENQEPRFYIGRGNSQEEQQRSGSDKRVIDCVKDEALCSTQTQPIKCKKCSLKRVQAPSLTASERTHSRGVFDTCKTCCPSRVDCVSERQGHQRPCMNICTRMGSETTSMMPSSKRRQPGHKTRSRSRTPPSSPSTSITDDTSGYPLRKKPPRKTSHRRRHSRVKRGFISEQSEELSVQGDGRKLTPASPTKSDTDTESSHYESLTKYQSNAKSVTHPSKVAPVEERKLRDSLNHWSNGGCMEGIKYEFGKISGMNLLNLTKKDSYKQYKVQKQKEKELAKENKKREEMETDKAAKKPFKEKHRDHDRECHRDKDREHERKEKDRDKDIKQQSVTPLKDKKTYRDREKHYTSDAEPNSITDDETQKYLSFKPTVILPKERFSREKHSKHAHKEHSNTSARKSKPIELGSDSLHKIHTRDLSKSHRRSSTATPNKTNTTTIQNNSTNSSMNVSKIGPQNHSKTDSEVVKRNQYLTKTKEKRCKTDSEVPSFERFTNTEGPWHEEEDEEYDCGTGLLGMDKIKPSKTGTVSLQTMESGPILVEKGVMKSNDSTSISSRDMKVGQEKPLTKQQAVGDDDVKRGAQETASQISNDNPQRSGAINSPVTAMICTPILESKETNAEKDLSVVPPLAVTEDRPFKMVKDMSQINLRSAVVISSVVTSSVSNPEDNIRRLVLEMPLYEKEEDGLITLVEKKSADLGKRKEHDRRKEQDVKDNSTFSSLLSCSCLQTSSSRITSTVVTDTEIMCSCCGKYIISSESSLVIGDQNGFCWPCYCQSTKRDWNPADPFFQQPDHMCQCYNKIDDSALEKIRETLRQLAEIDKAEAKNVTATPSASKLPATTNGNGNRLVCHSCNKKIKREERDGVKKPVAYLLKFEPGEDIEGDEKPDNMASLQEIRVKVPLKTNKKGGGTLGTTTATTALASGRNKHKERSDGEQQGGASHGRRDPRNLQDYLSSNRPDFVRSAEKRRQCLMELAYMREQRCRNYQELLAFSNGGIPLNFLQEQLSNNKPRIFTTKQMKRMTANNYKKLPEVQEKLLTTKRERAKQSNKLLVSIFNKKLRQTVLRGQASLSTSINVLNL